jgi:hypothetical protein
MDRVTVELMSRPIPYSAAEIAYARRRPVHEHTPTPEVGDTVWCRLDEWAEPHEALVTGVQPADDVDDPHLFEVSLDGAGDPVLIEGRPVLNGVEDPWPTLWLDVRVPQRDGEFIKIVHTHTREARLRGSPGWLPLDWRTRRRYLPAQLEQMITDETDA